MIDQEPQMRWEQIYKIKKIESNKIMIIHDLELV